MICDEQVAGLAKAVMDGDVLAVALLLDRLYELGDERGKHLYTSVGWFLERVRSANEGAPHAKQDEIEKARIGLVDWVKRMFWSELHGGVVAALEWAKGELGK